MSEKVLKGHINDLRKQLFRLEETDPTHSSYNTKLISSNLNKAKKELAKFEPKTIKENMPASVIKHKQKLAYMTDPELADYLKDFTRERVEQLQRLHALKNNRYLNIWDNYKVNEGKVKNSIKDTLDVDDWVYLTGQQNKKYKVVKINDEEISVINPKEPRKLYRVDISEVHPYPQYENMSEGSALVAEPYKTTTSDIAKEFIVLLTRTNAIVQAEVLGILYNHDWEHPHTVEEIAQKYVSAPAEQRNEIDKLLAH